MRKTCLARRWLSLLLTLAMCLTLAPAALADDQTQLIKRIELNHKSLTLAREDDIQLAATAYAEDGSEIIAADWEADWESSNNNVISFASTPIDSNNSIHVTGVEPGTATVTVKPKGRDDVSATCTITVKATPTGLSVSLSPSKVNLVVGKGGQDLTASVTPTPSGADTSKVTYTWSSSDLSVATVSGNGNKATVTPVKKGSATITVTARYESLTATDTCDVTVEQEVTGLRLTPNNSITLDPGASSQQITATLNPGTVNESNVTASARWESSDEKVATVSRGIVYARAPGRATITAAYGTGSNEKVSTPITVEVSGISLEYTTLELDEEESVEAPRADLFGAAGGKNVNWMSMNPDVAEYSGGRIMGRGPGRTVIRASVSGGVYEASVTVDVNPGRTTIDRRDKAMSVSDTLSFGDLRSAIQNQVGSNETLSHITGLRVDTTQGTLYYKYYSEAEPGSGVAQEGSYYLNPRAGQRGLSDVTFVPKASFAGGTVTINYTAVSDTFSNYQCRILLTVEPRGSVPTLSMTTPYDTPIKLSSSEFDRICQELNGVGLNTVTFSQPSSRQGILYTNYIAPGNYGSVVSTSKLYTRQELDDIWFVPAAGFTGKVTISYTARGRGSTGSVYTGSLTITVGERSDIKAGGPAYTTASGGPVTFDDRDFEDYRDEILPSGDTLSYVQFDSLPSASQGVLYYDYRTAGSPGSRVNEGSSYYYGTRTPRLDRITFVPAESFNGTVRIPFTGWDRDGNRFSGKVEIAVRGSSGSGDIRYNCFPGQSVNFLNSDFTNLCRELTGRTLNYIIFQDLPDRYEEGSIYHSSNRVSSKGTRYYANTSNSNRISRLSFRATSSFFGSVDIPFVGYASNGDTFDGVITISSNGVSDWTIHYRADSNTAAVFDRDDFDSLSQWDVRENVRSVRFQVPSSNQGDLYRNYRSSSNKGTRITSSSTSIARSSLNQVAFVPAKSYTGTVYIDFTATADDGSVFDGTVEIAVERGEADVTARYYTQSTPVQFESQDFKQSSRTLSSIRFNSLPASSEGHLYYGYTSPLRQEREAELKTSYRASGSGNSLISDLTFVPRAGYTGTVILPYTGTNSNGSTFDGEVEITVYPTRSSAYFNDMAPYSDAQRAAVDFCRENNITRGMSSTQFGPENSIRRGDFALMLYQAMELDPRYNSKPFHDVSSGAYYAEAVDTLRALGIVSGVGGGNYAPSSTLSRQDAVCMIQRAMQVMDLGGYEGSPNYLNGYSDRDSVAGYAQGAMAFAVGEGYLPTRNGRLDPYQPLSRVDMAQMLHRVLTY